MSPPKETTKKVTSNTTSPVQPNAETPKVIESDPKSTEQVKIETTNAEPLAPPPRPTVANTPDYFSGNHGLSHETNPFEYSFAGGGSSTGGQIQTPGGTKLPSVAALTSPALPFWGTSAGLRSGPLSPAMLAGPAKDDYFGDGHHLRGGFPTPNESGLRSGLTPGGGGSMFPEPSPNTQSLFNSLQSGGATPTTLDFHRTAMNARQKAGEVAQHAKITSQPQESMNGLDVKPPQNRPFDETNDAANGLYLLAQAHNGPQQTNHYAVAPQAVIHAHPQHMQMGGQSQETSPHMGNRNGGSISTNSGRGVSEMSGMSEEEQQNRPNTRGKGKRPSTQENQVNGGRKASGQPAKQPANKKAKANNGNSMSMSMEPPSEDEQDMSKDEYNANGKKMTDDEKRKNFLERNRVAALKCRQRKKQWLANLQQKVEMYSVENDSLNQTVSQLRDELVNLKTLLLAHKDCPVSHSQGLSNGGIQQIVEGGYGNPHMNPYGMAAAMSNQHQQQMMAAQGFQRRES